MSTLADLRRLGYAITPAFRAGEVSWVYSVSGFGLSLYLADTDQETIDALADPAAHAERERQEIEGPPEEEQQPPAPPALPEVLADVRATMAPDASAADALDAILVRLQPPTDEGAS